AGPPFVFSLSEALALRELEAAAGLGAAVLLALDHAAVAGEEASCLDGAAQRRLELGERLADAVLDCTGLAGKTAARHCADNVILADTIGDLERLGNDQAQRRAGEKHLLIAAIDGDLAGARLDPHACDGILAATGR